MNVSGILQEVLKAGDTKSNNFASLNSLGEDNELEAVKS
jgi:hypothetical protein